MYLFNVLTAALHTHMSDRIKREIIKWKYLNIINADSVYKNRTLTDDK